MRAFLLMLCFCWMPSMAQHYWSQARIDEIFNILYTQGAGAAILEVESESVTSYDFGMDLLMQNKNNEALGWYSALIAGSQDREKHLFGKAWTEMEMGNFKEAMKTASVLKNFSNDPLVSARSHYLMAVIYKSSGIQEYVENEIVQAEAIYQYLGKTGGLNLCQALRVNSSMKSVTLTNRPLDREDE